MRLPLRASLLLAFLLVVATTSLIGTLAGISFLIRTLRGEAMRRIEVDLGAAWAVFDEERERVQVVTSLVSQSEPLRAALRSGALDATARTELASVQRKHGLDFLDVLDARGRRLPAASDAVVSDPILAEALAGRASSGPIVFEAERLALESTALAGRARIALVATEHAAPTSRSVEERGLVLEAATPLLHHDKVIGVVYGGVLLNRRLSLVDDIRNRVFGDQTYEGTPVGTVTLFLGDTRVATNVLLQGGTRALGTRVSDTVAETVLGRGQRYAARAFVVNDWYLSAYDPIRGPRGEILGIIYVGLLEKRYVSYGEGLARSYLEIKLLAVVLAVALAFYLARRFERPVEWLLAATRRLATGDLSARVETDGASRELHELALSFNSMAATLERRGQELASASKALETSLTETAEKNRAYLEMLGFVTHELKSPLASIVFAIGSLRDGILGPLNRSQAAALRSAALSADYLRDTIANYLNLTRIEEGALSLSQGRVRLRRDVVESLLERFSELAADRQMVMRAEVPEDLEVTADPALVVSVVQNLLSNAVKYGREGGEIRVRGWRDEPSGSVLLSVWNEGPGFPTQAIGDLFHRFGRLSAAADTHSGTGLGLFVSREIAAGHGGWLCADSDPGRWAEFTLALPAAHPVERASREREAALATRG
jgi:two-component system, NtrC family, sensor kinase